MFSLSQMFQESHFRPKHRCYTWLAVKIKPICQLPTVPVYKLLEKKTYSNGLDKETNPATKRGPPTKCRS